MTEKISTYDYDVAVIGGGPAGYTAAEAAAKVGLSVVLFEKNQLGGTCLNEGCIPTKTLLYSAKLLDNIRSAGKYGIIVPTLPTSDLPKIIARKNKIVRKLQIGVKAKMERAGVHVIIGEAEIVDGCLVRCKDESYTTQNIIICTGSEVFIPNSIPGLCDVPYWTHRDALNCTEPPVSLTVIGGGVIGMEFAAFYHALGTNVTVIEMQDEILGGIDREIASQLRMEYAKRGIVFLLGTKVDSVSQSAGDINTHCTTADGSPVDVTSQRLLIAVGRRPVKPLVENVTQNMYLCGDVNGKSMLAHTAMREAELAVDHILNGSEEKINYHTIPAVVYTNPEVASVGLTEETASSGSRIIRIPMTYSGRFMVENEGANGLCKIIVNESDERILGVHVLGNPASEIIALAGMAIMQKMTIKEWKNVIFPHPTVGEIFHEALS